jgi:RsiW-degrading membrane proteinase PrsW (M82 family)/predicted  nucleic acid-binding Zn-ribbon protein
MPITITCQGCGKRFRARESLSGRTVACPACGASLVIGTAEDTAAELLLGDAAKQEQPTPAAPDACMEAQQPERTRHRTSRARLDVRSMPPLTVEEPPTLLRHLHWLLVLSLIPLAFSLLQQRDEQDFVQRLLDTINQAPPEAQARADRAIVDFEQGRGSLDEVFTALPDQRLRGAFLPRGSWAHWLFTFGATLVFGLFLFALSLEGSARIRHLFAVGLFTGTIGILFLLAVQFIAMWTQGMIVIPRSIVGLLFLVVQFIGFSYRAAADPSNGFMPSLVGYTFGVGLREEICKAMPVIFRYREPSTESWRGAYLWGLASGAGFGLAEGVIYASDFYNGISGAGIYFVRNISCVALHALWTGSAAITIHQRQHLFQEEFAWYDWLIRPLAVVAVPMVVHGLYDTLLKKEMNALALLVALMSFGFLAFQISRLRGADDSAASDEFLREYKSRRRSMG